MKLLNVLVLQRAISAEIEDKHHSHILVFQVVTVEHKRTAERSELHEHLDFRVRPQHAGVHFESLRHWRDLSLLNLMRFQMHMNGMPPASTGANLREIASWPFALGYGDSLAF